MENIALCLDVVANQMIKNYLAAYLIRKLRTPFMIVQSHYQLCETVFRYSSALSYS